jgi:multiple sugar transport system permease protein
MLHRGQRVARLLLLLPALILLATLSLYPLVSVLYFSLLDYDYISGARRFVGLLNYSYLLGDPFFLVSVRNTVIFSVVSTLSQVALGLLFALLFDRSFHGRALALPLVVFPMTISTMVVSAIWRAWYHFDYGFLNNLLAAVGLERLPWLFDPKLALYSIALVDLWQWTPMAFLILLAGLRSIPREVYEAASIDGASGWESLRFVTLPLLRGHLYLALLLRTVDTLKIFDKVYALTGGGPGLATETITTYIYREGFKFFSVGSASAAAIVMLLITGVLAAVYAQRVLRGGP